MDDGRFGNFLFDCHKERAEYSIDTMTPSCWDHLWAQRDQLRNPLWGSAGHNESTVLQPRTKLRDVQLWKGWFLQWDEEQANAVHQRLWDEVSELRKQMDDAQVAAQRCVLLEAEIEHLREKAGENPSLHMALNNLDRIRTESQIAEVTHQTKSSTEADPMCAFDAAYTAIVSTEQEPCEDDPLGLLAASQPAAEEETPARVLAAEAEFLEVPLAK